MTRDETGWLAHEQGICAVSWSPDGELLATGGNDGLLHIWSVGEGGGKAQRTMSAHRGAVRALAWMPGDALLASGGEDGLVRVWDVATGRLVDTPQLHERWVNAVAWSPDGRRLAAAGGDRTVSITSLHGARMAEPLRSPYGVILSLAWAPDGAYLAGVGRSSLVNLWHANSGQVHAQLDNGPGAVWTVCWLGEGGTLATGNALGLIRLWDPKSKRLLETIRAHGGAVARVSWSRAGNVLATLSHDQTIALWDLTAGRRVQYIEPAYPGWTGCLEASPSAALLAGTDWTGREVRVWRIRPPGRPTTSPSPAELHARVVQAGNAERGWVTVADLAVALEREHPDLATPESWVKSILAQLAQEDDRVFFVADAGIAAWRPDRIRQLAARVVADAAGADVIVSAATENVLRRRPELGAGFEAGTTLLAAFVGCAAVRSRLGWFAGRDTARLHPVPEFDAGAQASRSTSVEVLALTWGWTDETSAPSAGWIFTTIMGTTLFSAWTTKGGELIVRDAIGGLCWIACRRTGERGHTLTFAGANNAELRESLAELVAARLARERPPLGRPARASSVGERFAVEEADWKEWDDEAVTWWSLTAGELTGGRAGALAVLDEQVDDELARQERLAFVRALDADHALLWHVPAMREAAAQLAHALAVAGLRVSCHDVQAADPRSLVSRSERVSAVLVLLGPAVACWRSSPLAEPYAQMALGAEGTGRRTRWLPVVTGELAAASTTGIPDHLRSFDWYRWRGAGAPERSQDVRALVGAILLDRTRS